MFDVKKLNSIGEEIRDELDRAAIRFVLDSAHEGYAVLLEEVDELKAHVWTRQNKRDIAALRKEAIQVAAMAIRFVYDVCNETSGRK